MAGPSARDFGSIRDRLHLRAILVIVLVAGAYHYSFATLGRSLLLQTPLSFLALVPLIAIGLAWATARRSGPVASINDRQVDYIIGIGLAGAAGVVALLSPMSLGASFWTYRVDLLSIPLFVAAMVAIFYGVRHVWLLRWPIAFLVLAWPVPYLPFLGDLMRSTVELTVSVLAALGAILPWAHPLTSVSAGAFAIDHAGGSFVVSVTAACSGINSLVGFGLIGVAIASVLQGSLLRRVGWLIAGMALVLLVNVVRIEAIFATGALFGPDAALQVIHPIAGLVTFNVALVAMLLVIPTFGLELRRPWVAAVAPSAPARTHVRRIRGAVLFGLALGVGFAAINAMYDRFDGRDDSLIVAHVAPAEIPTVFGWQVAEVGEFDSADMFGSGSTWNRVRYTSTPVARLRSSLPLYVDSITTADASVLAAYGVQAIYPVPGYDLLGASTVELSDSVVGELMTYVQPQTGRTWSLVSWTAPTGSGTETASVERLTILFPNARAAEIHGILPNDIEITGEDYGRTEEFLVGLARTMVEEMP